jgi:autotransporter family porin
VNKGAVASVLISIAILAGGCSGSAKFGLSSASPSARVAPALTSPSTTPPATSPQFVSGHRIPTSGTIGTGHFSSLPLRAALPSDSTCAGEVRPAPEVRPANAVANATRGVGGNSAYPRVTGNYVGTTDEIIQWAACKWGIDEDVVRAQAALESYWFQRTTGDFSTDSSTCVPGHQTVGADGQAGRCPQSIGIMQVRYPYHDTAFAANNDATVSTAYNLDYTYATWRNCFDGNDEWFNQFNPPKPYKAGDLWGCVGAWYSGRWYDSGAVTYISRVQSYVTQRIWTTPGFAHYS